MSRAIHDERSSRDAGRKRKAGDHSDASPAKQRRDTEMYTVAEVHVSCVEQPDQGVENATPAPKKMEEDNVRTRNIVTPSINWNLISFESGQAETSKKRSFEEAELEEERRVFKHLFPRDIPVNSSCTSPAKPQLVPWHLVPDRGEPRVHKRHPERYWVPDEWCESLDYI